MQFLQIPKYICKQVQQRKARFMFTQYKIVMNMKRMTIYFI